MIIFNTYDNFNALFTHLIYHSKIIHSHGSYLIEKEGCSITTQMMMNPTWLPQNHYKCSCIFCKINILIHYLLKTNRFVSIMTSNPNLKWLSLLQPTRLIWSRTPHGASFISTQSYLFCTVVQFSYTTDLIPLQLHPVVYIFVFQSVVLFERSKSSKRNRQMNSFDIDLTNLQKEIG